MGILPTALQAKGTFACCRLQVPGRGSHKRFPAMLPCCPAPPAIEAPSFALQAPGRGGLFARGRGGRGRRGHPRALPYNRNKFLQANFRFMVSDASDLQRHQTDADLMLDWEDVLQVTFAFLPI